MKLVDLIIEDMKTNPDDWYCAKWTVEHRKSEIAIWNTDIPILSLHIYRPYEIYFNIYDKLRLYFAIKKIIKNEHIKLTMDFIFKTKA